jgi:hypothetical protein
VVNITGPPRRRAGHRAVVVETRGVGLGVAMVDRADVVDDLSRGRVLPESTCARIPRLSASKSRSLHVDRLDGHEKLAHWVIVSSVVEDCSDSRTRPPVRQRILM